MYIKLHWMLSVQTEKVTDPCSSSAPLLALRDILHKFSALCVGFRHCGCELPLSHSGVNVERIRGALMFPICHWAKPSLGSSDPQAASFLKITFNKWFLALWLKSRSFLIHGPYSQYLSNFRFCYHFFFFFTLFGPHMHIPPVQTYKKTQQLCSKTYVGSILRHHGHTADMIMLPCKIN